ncbi:MAG: hypothetical protein F6K65_38960 [Moorea sp. SIO3C2]|nr:hypothetical protein [Moorena sp. SIO3C2]
MGETPTRALHQERTSNCCCPISSLIGELKKFAGLTHTPAIKTGSLSSSLKTSWEKVLDKKLRVELSGG